MGRGTKFSDSWLKQTDRNNYIIGDWCERVRTDHFSARCKVCKKVLSTAKMGVGQVMSHAAGRKHNDAMTVLKGQSVFKKLPVKPAVTDSGNTSATHGDLERSLQVEVQLGVDNWYKVGSGYY
jgi:hypothetical protein